MPSLKPNFSHSRSLANSNQLAHFGFVGLRQIAAGDIRRTAVGVPRIRFPGTGVDAVDNDLLAVSQRLRCGASPVSAWWGQMVTGSMKSTRNFSNGCSVRNKIANFGASP